jgi:hypothetical protein
MAIARSGKISCGSTVNNLFGHTQELKGFFVSHLASR